MHEASQRRLPRRFKVALWGVQMSTAPSSKCGTCGSEFSFEPLLNDEQAAALLGGISVKALQRMARNKEIPARKIGRYWYFRASELNSWLEQSSGNDVNSNDRPCLVMEK